LPANGTAKFQKILDHSGKNADPDIPILKQFLIELQTILNQTMQIGTCRWFQSPN